MNEYTLVVNNGADLLDIVKWLQELDIMLVRYEPDDENTDLVEVVTDMDLVAHIMGCTYVPEWLWSCWQDSGDDVWEA